MQADISNLFSPPVALSKSDHLGIPGYQVFGRLKDPLKMARSVCVFFGIFGKYNKIFCTVHILGLHLFTNEISICTAESELTTEQCNVGHYFAWRSVTFEPQLRISTSTNFIINCDQSTCTKQCPNHRPNHANS